MTMKTVIWTGTKHELKSWPREFEAVLDGSKTFEVRVNDRDYKEGDILFLREYDPDVDSYTGRTYEALVTYIYAGNKIDAPVKLAAVRLNTDAVTYGIITSPVVIMGLDPALDEAV